MRWSHLLATLSHRGQRGPTNVPAVAAARWRHAQSLFNETIGTITPNGPSPGAAVRAVDSAIAELWAAERQMALQFDGADRSTPVVWPWMQRDEEPLV